MKHFKDLFSILCLLFITSAFVACDDDNDEYATDDETILSVPQDDLIFTVELSDVLVPVRTEVVSLILMQPQVELRTVLNYSFIQRRQQHMVFIIEVGDR